MKGKFKKILTLAAVAVTALALTGCGGSKSGGSDDSAELSIDVAALASELNEKTITTDELAENESSMLSTIYFTEDGQVEESSFYMSGGATADEICVVKCTDEDTAKAVAELFQTRADNQAELYSTYNTDEEAKLKDAIVRSSGVYAVFVVCDDYDAAEKILETAGIGK